MATLVCDIVTPEAKLYSDEAYMVVVPGVEGEMGFLPGHAQLVSALADGTVRISYADNQEPKHFACQGGYVQVTGEKVIVLANRAVLVSDIDVAACKSQLSELEAQLAKLSEEEASKTMLPTDIAWMQTQINAFENK